MTSAKVSSSIAILTLCLWSFAASAQQDVAYSLTLIGKGALNDPGSFFSINDMNDRGELVGSRSLPDGSSERFIWRDGSFTTNNTAFLINDRSELVGLDSSTLPLRAFLVRRDNTVVPIEPPQGEQIILLERLNNRRQVLLGTFESNYVWRAGSLLPLESLPGSPSTLSIDMNNHGIAVGNAGIPSGSQPVIWQEDGSVRQLPIPQGAVSAGVEAINDHGIAVGESVIQHSEAVLWQELMPTLLPALNATNGADAADVNNHEVVAGRSFTATGSIATIWRHRLPVDLNTRIASNDPARPFVHLEWAVKINNRGQILARAQDSRDAGQDLASWYLLTPRR
jgi:hypothetical protein